MDGEYRVWIQSMRKPKYKLELLTPTQRELEEIALVHMELVGVESARKITDRIYNALDHFRSHPNMDNSVHRYNAPVGRLSDAHLRPLSVYLSTIG